MASLKRVFDSVFPPSRLQDCPPSQAATPVAGQTTFGESFGGAGNLPLSSTVTEASDVYPEPVIWDRSWHTATTLLTLPSFNFLVHRGRDDLDRFAAYYDNAPKDALEAIRYVISHQLMARGREPAVERGSIVDWYTDHIRGHFLSHSKASLTRLISSPNSPGVDDGQARSAGRDEGAILFQMRDCLGLLQSMYTYPLARCILPQLTSLDATLAKNKFQRDLRALASHALQPRAVAGLLTKYLGDCSRKILGVEDEEFEIALAKSNSPGQTSTHRSLSSVPNVTYRTYYTACASMVDIKEAGDTFIEPEHVIKTRHELLSFMQTWSSVGLGAVDARKIFATVLDEVLGDFIFWSYAGVEDDDESSVLPHLKYWIENIFARFSVQVLNALRSGEDVPSSSPSEINLADVQDWQDMAITRLGAVRVSELYGMVVDCDNSRSRLDDLRYYITNPSTRTYLTHKFMGVLSWSLLQPGISTQQILRVYISIIRAFRRLDPKGVLLDRVARPLRRYLRDRDDTVRVIVTGLFSDPRNVDAEPVPQDAEVVNELATELKEHGISNANEDQGDIDWNNMEWLPDPIDVAPDYKKSKNFDVIGSLMSLFESRDAIVKELQVMLSDRLLMRQKNFNQETTVLELLKTRLGEHVLQSCSVMLRDVKRESVSIDQSVRREQGLEPSGARPASENDKEQHLDLHAKILSYMYWPTLQNQTFQVPTQVLAQQHLYEGGYSVLKPSRKLTWLNALGQVEIELEFEDRLFQGEVTPWEASVIHAFESDTTSSEPVSRSIDDLATELNMSPLLVRSACKLWLSKSVLIETSPDTYQVQERLAMSIDSGPGASTRTKPDTATSQNQSSSAAAAAAAAETAASLAASSASSSLLEQKMAVYHQFILSLLTNQGAMPLPRIVMMLGMVVPGGFPFSTDELKEFLGRMVREGEIETGAGGVYKAVQQ